MKGNKTWTPLSCFTSEKCWNLSWVAAKSASRNSLLRRGYNLFWTTSKRTWERVRLWAKKRGWLRSKWNKRTGCEGHSPPKILWSLNINSFNSNIELTCIKIKISWNQSFLEHKGILFSNFCQRKFVFSNLWNDFGQVLNEQLFGSV